MGIQKATSTRMGLDALEYARSVWESLDSPMSLSCYLLAVNGEWKQLVEKAVNPALYMDPSEFFRDYQAVKLLSKYPFLDTGIDREAVAREKFAKSEVRCRETNERFRRRSDGERFTPQVERVLFRAQQKIATILGDVPSYSDMDFSFGPGAAYGVRKRTSVFHKVTATLECTHAMAGILAEFLGEFPGWIREDLPTVRLIPGCQLAFVPKDAKTDRPIGIEPLLNGLYQKGVGSFLRARLRNHGINLDDQGVNQKLASQAINRCLATVDFSSASDTVAYGLVLDLLPIDWFEFLEVARSPSYQWGDCWANYQKFSSMGNAYTFELETLLFYALAIGCCEELGIGYETGFNLSVYGDDVIIPQAAFHLYQEVAEVCGFELNYEKSFHQGLFFESCGHDFFLGYLVRPFQVKRRIDTLLGTFLAANVLRRLQRRLKDVPSIKKEAAGPRVVHSLNRVHSRLVGRLPRRLRIRGPEGYGDGHLIAEVDECRPTRHPSWDGWEYKTYAEQAIRYKLPVWPMAYCLYSVRSLVRCDLFDRSRALDYRRVVELEEDNPALHMGKGYTVRGKTRTRLIPGFCHDWPSLGLSDSFPKGGWDGFWVNQRRNC